LFISGLSMGGHGALYLFSQRPDLFRSAGSTSGVVDLRTSADKYNLTGLLGNLGDHQVRWIRFSVLGNLDRIAAAKKEIIFDCGVEDGFYNVNNELRDRCLQLNIPATFISQPGAHNRLYWQKAIRAHFAFFKRLASQPTEE
ncbi:MAG: esterase, partial [Ferruginibacter sp.]|nr:esterase [Cytophagales bacterium]